MKACLDVCANQCGAQCCKAPGYFYMTQDEFSTLNDLGNKMRIPFKVYFEGDLVVMDHDTNGGQCPFLNSETNACRIYKDRPTACREFPTKPMPRCLIWPGEKNGTT